MENVVKFGDDRRRNLGDLETKIIKKIETYLSKI